MYRTLLLKFLAISFRLAKRHVLIFLSKYAYGSTNCAYKLQRHIRYSAMYLNISCSYDLLDLKYGLSQMQGGTPTFGWPSFL
jgi:hypothetical protein